MKNLRKAIDVVEPKSLLVGGGVSANSALRSTLIEEADTRNLDLRLPSPDFCLDNAAMIAFAGLLNLQAGCLGDLTDDIDPNLSLYPEQSG